MISALTESTLQWALVRYHANATKLLYFILEHGVQAGDEELVLQIPDRGTTIIMGMGNVKEGLKGKTQAS